MADKSAFAYSTANMDAASATNTKLSTFGMFLGM